MKAKRVIVLLSVILVVYFALGLGFHVKWTDELARCNEVLREQGEFVEPEMFRISTAFVFNVVNWPVYSLATLYHDGTLFATPCTHKWKPPNNSLQPTAPSLAALARSQRLSSVPFGVFSNHTACEKRMVKGYFYEMACVIAEYARVLKPNTMLFMVNDNCDMQTQVFP